MVEVEVVGGESPRPLQRTDVDSPTESEADRPEQCRGHRWAEPQEDHHQGWGRGRIEIGQPGRPRRVRTCRARTTRSPDCRRGRHSRPVPMVTDRGQRCDQLVTGEQWPSQREVDPTGAQPLIAQRFDDGLGCPPVGAHAGYQRPRVPGGIGPVVVVNRVGDALGRRVMGSDPPGNDWADSWVAPQTRLKRVPQISTVSPAREPDQ